VIVLEAGRVLDQGAPDTVLARQAAIDQQGESDGESESEKMGGI
jgi:hypothetical protein